MRWRSSVRVPRSSVPRSPALSRSASLRRRSVSRSWIRWFRSPMASARTWSLHVPSAGGASNSARLARATASRCVLVVEAEVDRHRVDVECGGELAHAEIGEPVLTDQAARDRDDAVGREVEVGTPSNIHRIGALLDGGRGPWPPRLPCPLRPGPPPGVLGDRNRGDFAEVDTEETWLSDDDLATVRGRVPMVYVDAVPVRVDSVGEVATSVSSCAMADGTISRALVTGRVVFGERIRHALLRHLEKDLGPMALPASRRIRPRSRLRSTSRIRRSPATTTSATCGQPGVHRPDRRRGFSCRRCARPGVGHTGRGDESRGHRRDDRGHDRLCALPWATPGSFPDR